MKNSDIYKIAYNLGMIDEDSHNCGVIESVKSDAEIFEQETATDLVKTMNFVDDLCLYNDLDTIKKFLVAIIYQNK